jgi:hypothetical protein
MVTRVGIGLLDRRSMEVVANEIQAQKGLRHQQRGGPDAAAHIRHTDARLQSRQNAVQRRKPGSHDVVDIAGRKKAPTAQNRRPALSLQATLSPVLKAASTFASPSIIAATRSKAPSMKSELSLVAKIMARSGGREKRAVLSS